MRYKDLVIEDNNPLPEHVAQAFKDLGEMQRGEAERVMLRIQHTMGGGVLNPVVEHAGDIIHRCTHLAKYNSFLYDTTMDKVEKVLRWLTHSYGFEKELNQNITNNAAYYDRKGIKTSAEDLKIKLDSLLIEYANQHNKLNAYNEFHYYCKKACVNIGHQNWNSAILALYRLKDLGKNSDIYLENVKKYYTDNGKLIQYTPGIEK